MPMKLVFMESLMYLTVVSLEGLCLQSSSASLLLSMVYHTVAILFRITFSSSSMFIYLACSCSNHRSSLGFDLQARVDDVFEHFRKDLAHVANAIRALKAGTSTSEVFHHDGRFPAFPKK
mmetsp:Transcript_4427/g.10940  ORF Transcript_4427/g.10940 Transcript_4427/m.10940 type:complete len:120 (-) Transcript_4427:85-444(-)